MYNLMLMAIENSRENLFHDDSSVFLSEGFLLLYLVKQFTTKAEFGDNVEELLVLVKFIDFDNIGVVLLT